MTVLTLTFVAVVSFLVGALVTYEIISAKKNKEISDILDTELDRLDTALKALEKYEDTDSKKYVEKLLHDRRDKLV